MFYVNWTVAYEAYRLWSQMLEIYTEDCLVNDDPNLTTIDYLFEYSKNLTESIYLFGPINGVHSNGFLPRPWRDCSNIDEVKEMNRLAQQMLIKGEVWPILEILATTPTEREIKK